MNGCCSAALCHDTPISSRLCIFHPLIRRLVSLPSRAHITPTPLRPPHPAIETRRISPPYWQVCALAAIACSGNTWTDTVVLVTNVRNLPQHRGTVVGIIKSCEGLSASVFTAIYLGVFAPHAKPFLLFMAVAPAVIDLVGTLFVGHVPFIQHSELKRRGRRTFTTGVCGGGSRSWYLCGGWEQWVCTC